MLARDFEVGWGPRLNKQMSNYIPVVIEAGGTVGEATDRILAMRILRKLKDRHDNQPEQLLELRKKIVDSWQRLDTKHESEPVHSLKMLNSELKRTGHFLEHSP